jgi:hypothetical protein
MLKLFNENRNSLWDCPSLDDSSIVSIYPVKNQVIYSNEHYSCYGDEWMITKDPIEIQWLLFML